MHTKALARIRRLATIVVVLSLILAIPRPLPRALAQGTEPDVGYCPNGACIDAGAGGRLPGGNGPDGSDDPQGTDGNGPGDPGDSNGNDPGGSSPPQGNNPTPVPTAPPTPCPGGVCPTPTPTPTPGPYQVQYRCIPLGDSGCWTAVTIVMAGGSAPPSREEVTAYMDQGPNAPKPDSWLQVAGYFQSPSECEGSSSDSPGPTDSQDLPCPATYSDDGGLGTDCGWNIYTRDCLLPVRVKRQPWPRGLVTVPNILELMPDPRWGQAGEGGAWSGKAPQGYPDANTRNYTIGLRWKRITNDAGQEVCWDWDERPWNIGKDYGYGEIKAVTCGNPGTHIYETSSGDKIDPTHYGDEGDKPRNGPGLDMRTDLPAYQVGITTYWEAQWKVEYDRYEVVDHVEGWYYDGVVAGNMECNPAFGDPRCKWVSRDEWDWVHHEDGWHTIDLSKLRPGPWYEEWHGAVSFNGTPTHDNWVEEVPGIPIPIIEVQSVIVD